MNVLTIVCNSFHLGFLGSYGNAWIETPHLDRLAAEGIVFDHHYPENLTTLPTRRSWWTGRYGFHDPDQGWTPLRTEERILPDLLWNQGVRTALISDVPYLRDPTHGFGRGFDDVRFVRGQGYDLWIPAGDPRGGKPRLAEESGLRLPHVDDPHHELWTQRWEQYLRNRNALRFHEIPGNTGPARLVDAAIEWLESANRESSNSPFFLWLDMFSPHGPWDPPQPFRDQYATLEPDDFELGDEGDLVDEPVEEFDADWDLREVNTLIDVPPGAVGDVIDEAELLRLRRTYAGVVTLVDQQIGRLVDTLRQLGRLDDTLIIFTSDQGEPLGEHGYVRRFRPWLYEELIHTPLILRMPGAKWGGSRHRGLVQPVDLAPTVLEFLGVRPPEDFEPHGKSLLPLIRGEMTKIRDYACLGMDLEELAIRTHLWHYLLPLEVDEDEPREPELYRKPEDRFDQNNVIDAHTEVGEHLELTLRRFVDALRKGVPDDQWPYLRDVARFALA